MRLIYGSPTTGKSTYQREMAKRGKAVVDTDSLIEAMVLGLRGIDPRDWKQAWEWWKSAPHEDKAPIVASVRALVERWRATLGDETIVVTNLHWPDMRPDAAYGRVPADIVTEKRAKYKAEGRELTEEDATRMLKWDIPTELGTDVEVLPAGRYLVDLEGAGPKTSEKRQTFTDGGKGAKSIVINVTGKR